MMLLPEELRFALRANRIARNAAGAEVVPDPVPILKLFNPVGPATWLASELADDDDTLFGMADLGFGCPELGAFSLCEIARIRLPYGLRIEWNTAFSSPHPLPLWAHTARRLGSLILAEAHFRSAAGNGPSPMVPPA